MAKKTKTKVTQSSAATQALAAPVADVPLGHSFFLAPAPDLAGDLAPDLASAGGSSGGLDAAFAGGGLFDKVKKVAEEKAKQELDKLKQQGIAKAQDWADQGIAKAQDWAKDKLSSGLSSAFSGGGTKAGAGSKAGGITTPGKGGMPGKGGAGGGKAPYPAPIPTKGKGSLASAANAVARKDPSVAYAYEVSIGDARVKEIVEFTEISGITWKAEPQQVREGGNNEFATYMLGPGQFEPLSLKRGWFSAQGHFFKWLAASLDPAAPFKRTNLTITIKDRKMKPIAMYNFAQAFIVEYSGPPLNSMQSQIGFEQIRIAYDYFKFVPLG